MPCAGPGGHPTLPCVSPQAMSTQREPSHALRCSWGTQRCPCLVAMPCAAPWVPSVSPAMPCVGHGATHLQMACGVIQLFVGSPNSPSCHWHGATNAHAGGMAWHWCTTMVLVACAAPSCLWHGGTTQLQMACSVGSPNFLWGHPQLPQLPLAWATNAHAGGMALVHHHGASISAYHVAHTM